MPPSLKVYFQKEILTKLHHLENWGLVKSLIHPNLHDMDLRFEDKKISAHTHTLIQVNDNPVVKTRYIYIYIYRCKILHA